MASYNAGEQTAIGATRSSLKTRVVAAILCVSVLGACSTSGASRKSIERAASSTTIDNIAVVPLTNAVARSLSQTSLDAAQTSGFAESFGDVQPVGAIIGRGDVLEVSIWEAPPAALFGSIPQSGEYVQTSRTTTLPEFLVGPTGTISVPFAGEVRASGRTLPQIERDIINRLRGKAHLPQVIVRLLRNATANITVVGDVKNSSRVPLTPKGERLLDALAAAGGTTQPVEKMTVQISRNGLVRRMALQDVIDRPSQNIVLQTDDVVTAIFRPYSFTVLGASGRNEEINFEGTGITLAQAMGRVGGLQDGRADPKGVFIFRWEQTTPAIMDVSTTNMQTLPSTPYPQGLPVIYQVNLRDPSVFFAMQNFQMEDGDVMFVANSSLSEIQRFAGIISSTLLPAVAIENSVSN